MGSVRVMDSEGVEVMEGEVDLAMVGVMDSAEGSELGMVGVQVLDSVVGQVVVPDLAMAKEEVMVMVKVKVVVQVLAKDWEVEKAEVEATEMEVGWATGKAKDWVVVRALVPATGLEGD